MRPIIPILVALSSLSARADLFISCPGKVCSDSPPKCSSTQPSKDWIKVDMGRYMLTCPDLMVGNFIYVAATGLVISQRALDTASRLAREARMQAVDLTKADLPAIQSFLQDVRDELISK